MRIYFERSGGFMGLAVAGTIDTELLAEDESSALIALVEAAGFFDLPNSMTATPEAADSFQYKVEIVDGERRHLVLTDGAMAPDALWPLLRRLTILARTGADRDID